MDKHQIRNVKEWAKIRDTSLEIAEVIFEAANNDEALAQQIWENGDDHVLAKAFAQTDKDELIWNGEIAQRDCGA
ncbi:YccJ family protein [Utexia brackfieldae]|uniref:YccJ family protein n=1 Tax=Utexia brackfieldae TaxID=3074108 RepID=UPI00370D985D